MIGKRVYLGDHIYAKYTGDGIEMTCNNGAENNHRIFLNNDNINKLDHFKYLIVKWLKEAAAQRAKQVSACTHVWVKNPGGDQCQRCFVLSQQLPKQEEEPCSSNSPAT